MADATFNDVLQETKKTNEILRQNAKDADKPNPVKYIKEEGLTIVLDRQRHKQSISLDKEAEKDRAVAEKARDKALKGDSKYYKKQVDEQSLTTTSQKKTEKGVKVGSIERFDQNYHQGFPQSIQYLD